MKRLIFPILLLLSISTIRAQETRITAFIPDDYKKDSRFEAQNATGETILEFQKSKGNNFAITQLPNGQIKTLLKHKVLVQNGDTLAIYKRHSIHMPNENLTIIEKKIKHGWQYSAGDELLLTVNSKYDKEKRGFHITATTSNDNETTQALLPLCLGQLDKKVVHKKDFYNDWIKSDDVVDDTIYLVIIPLIIAFL
jgi:hypothetical protein